MKLKLDSQSWFWKIEEALINHQLYSGQATQIAIYILGMTDWFHSRICNEYVKD